MKLRVEPWENRLNLTIFSLFGLALSVVLIVDAIWGKRAGLLSLAGLFPAIYVGFLSLKGLWNRFDHAEGGAA